MPGKCTLGEKGAARCQTGTCGLEGPSCNGDSLRACEVLSPLESTIRCELYGLVCMNAVVEPKQVNPHDKLHIECTYDNPNPTDLEWGEGTADEMCLGSFYVTQ